MEDSSKIRVLIADDSFFMRKLLRQILNSDPEIDLVGEAKDGAEAVALSNSLLPDVITMDYKMPILNGIEAIRQIKKTLSDPPVVIMLSAYTTEGANETWEALKVGAADFIPKPSGELSLDIDTKRDEILGKIKALASTRKRQKFRGNTILPEVTHDQISKSIRLVVIGSSTGGPPIVEHIISGLPENLNATIIIAQHMPSTFTKSFAKRINGFSKIPTKEAEEGDIIEVGKCFVCQGDFNTVLYQDAKGQIRFKIIASPINTLRPSIDALMISAADFFKEKVLGIELSGMGADGLEGMHAIKLNSGKTIVQDPATSAVDSMPQSVIDDSIADFILKPDEISKKIVGLTGIR